MTSTIVSRLPRLSAVFGVAFAMILAGILPGEEPRTRQPAKTKSKDRPAQTAVLAKNTVMRDDVAYGKDEKQRLDVYSPGGVKSAPIVVFIHGGEWTKGDKSAVSFKPKFFNESGIVFVSVNYRLYPAAKHPSHVDDVAAAVKWVRENVEVIGGDPSKVILMGHSAGCHLVTLTALDPRHLARVKLAPANIRGVIAWSGGAYDLVEKVKSGGSYESHIKNAFGEAESTWRDASPITHAKNAKVGPSFLFVSIESGNASHKAAERMVELIRGAGGKAESRLIEGRDHFHANHLLGAPEDATGKVLVDFIRKVCKD